MDIYFHLLRKWCSEKLTQTSYFVTKLSCINHTQITVSYKWHFCYTTCCCLILQFFFYFSRIFFISFLSLPLLHWPPWSSSYGSWIYNYLCHQCLSYLKLWVRIPLKAKCTRYSFMWSSFSVTCCRSLIFSGFLHQKPWSPWYNWKIVESGVTHHNH